MSFQVPELYPYLLIVVSLLNAENYYITNFLFSGGKRLTIYTGEYMKQYKDMHETAMKGTKLPQFGNPDQGNG